MGATAGNGTLRADSVLTLLPAPFRKSEARHDGTGGRIVRLQSLRTIPAVWNSETSLPMATPCFWKLDSTSPVITRSSWRGANDGGQASGSGFATALTPPVQPVPRSEPLRTTARAAA